ncbi:MAG: hypothetical protein PT956_01950 [Firmicutes bacterium]|nr:hypothetical protein [Bacillota bacterium]
MANKENKKSMKLIDEKLKRKNNYMRLFIGFALPIIGSIIYYALENYFHVPGFILTILSIAFCALWIYYARYIAKNEIVFNKGLLFMHGFMYICAIISIIAAVWYPNAPVIINQLSALANAYTLVVSGLSYPALAFLAIAFNSANTNTWLSLSPVISAALLTALYSIGYEIGDR